MEQLKKCPFCGGEADLCNSTVIRDENWLWSVECVDCGVIIDSESKEDVIKAWNTRKPMENIIERIENEILEELSDCGDDWFTAEQINKAIDIVKEEGL